MTRQATANGGFAGDAVRRNHVDCGKGIRGSLAHYAARTRQCAHRHDFSQISFLLSGAMRERLEGRDYELDHAAVGMKPAGLLHEDAWGREGVLIFSLMLSPNHAAAAGRLASPAWSRLADPGMVGTLIRCCLLAPAETVRAEAAADLLDLIGTNEPAASATAPAWLDSARARIAAEPDCVTVESVAHEAGVDRAHLSRMFRRCYGMAPSIFRQRRLAARAVGAIARAEGPISMVAAEGGYSDQAHLTRSLKTQTGLPPAQLRKLLRKPDHIHSIRS